MNNKKIKLIPYVSTGPYRVCAAFYGVIHFCNLHWDSTLIYDRIKFSLAASMAKYKHDGK